MDKVISIINTSIGIMRTYFSLFSDSLVEIKRKPEKKKRKSIEDDESAFDELHSHFNQQTSNKENP